MTIAVSIVIPAYNAKATIDSGLESLIRQENVTISYEIVVVDDCSTDDTVERVERFATEHAGGLVPIRLLRQSVNQGPAAARNRGAGVAAAGDILLFTDSDCELHPRWLVEMIAPFEARSVAGVKGAYRTKQPEIVARFAQAEFEDRYRLLERSQFVDVLFSYSAAIRKSVFWEVGGFDTSFPVADNEDTDLSWKVVAAGYRIVFNPKAIVYHRHPATVRSYLRKKFWRAYWRACVYRRFPEKAVKDSYTPQGLKLQILLVYLGGFAVLCAAISPWGGYALMGIAAAFLFTTVPFLLSLPRSQPDLLLVAPLLLVARAAVMGAGLIWVVPRLLRAAPFDITKATR